jgi:DNA-binding NtrC family response regulator
MPDKLRILIADDDRAIGRMLASLCEMEGYPFHLVTRGEAAIEALSTDPYDVVLSDIYMGDVSGLDVLEAARKSHPDVEVVIMTAHGSVETAVRAVRNGAFDYISKPFAVDSVLEILKRIEEKSRLLASSTLGSDLADELPDTEIIGTSAAMVAIYNKLARIAAIDSPVLVYGETGAGKELVARAIHRNSPRSSAPFVVINCGALTETLLEAELFGHEKGAFTGAVGARKGLFESAAGGTVFLDEVSETSLAFQVRLLRVIQEREIRRVGSNDTIDVDVRAVAATNRDLRRLVSKEQFREDLFHRLNVFTISLPPLRERLADLPVLASHFLKRYGEEYGREVRLLPEALAAMKAHPWPGNVRELKNVMERAFAFCDNGLIGVDDLELEPSGPASDDLEAENAPRNGSLEEMERDHILKTLRETGGNKKKAAEILGIERRTLYNKARRLGIDLKGAQA